MVGVRQGRDLQFSCGEVDVDAAKVHVDRGSTEGKHVHKGRLFILVERATRRRKIVTLDDLTVEAPFRLPPESTKDIKADVQATLQPGSMGCGDGGTAIASSVRSAADGKVPLATAIHGRKPVKQFTRLVKIPKADVSEELMDAEASRPLGH